MVNGCCKFRCINQFIKRSIIDVIHQNRRNSKETVIFDFHKLFNSFFYFCWIIIILLYFYFYLFLLQSFSLSFAFTFAYLIHTRKPCCRTESARCIMPHRLKSADNIYYKFKSSQASKARLQSSKHTGAKQNLTQNGH